MFRLLRDKSKQIYFIYLLTFFIGVYFMSYMLSIPFISRPAEHFCAPPFDFNTEHLSPKDWKIYAIPYWDQVPKSMQKRTIKTNTQSECFQFVLQLKNSSDSVKTYEIHWDDNRTIKSCSHGWYFRDKTISIISQFKLVCDNQWVLQTLPLISSIGFILSTVVLYFENYLYIIIGSIVVMLSSSLSIVFVHNISLLMALKFLSSLFFGSNFLSILTLSNKFRSKLYFKSNEVMLFTGIFGSIIAKGTTLLLIYITEDWKVVQILISFSIMPIVIFGIILFIMHTNDSECNINFVEEVEDNPEELESTTEKPEDNTKISDKRQLFLLSMTALLYFYEDLAQHQKMEKHHTLFDPTFILVQIFNISLIFLSKRRISLKYTILVALIAVCLTNICLSISGIFEFKYNGKLEKLVEYLNKIGVSIAFYANIFIFIELLDKTNIIFNIILVHIIMLSYGLTPFVFKLNEVNSWILRVFLSLFSFLAIIVVIIKCFISNKVLKRTQPKQRRQTVIYSNRFDTNEEKLFITNE